MLPIEGFEEARKQIGLFAWSEFSVVQELQFQERANSDRAIADLLLTLQSVERNPNWNVTLSFFDVSDFSISNFHGGMAIVGLDIVNITDRNWEKINWELLDYENRAIHLFADTVSVAKIKAIMT